MSTLGYGMYGFNVINANGETDSLPTGRLISSVAVAIGNPGIFSEACDEYGMVVSNQGANAASWSAIRTPVSGLYEIEYSITLPGGAGAGVAEVQTYADCATAFLASGATGCFSPGGTPGYYQLAGNRQALLAATSYTLAKKMTIFLEKDRYISIYTTGISGTAPTYAGNAYDFLSVRCISTENSGKASWQV